MIGEKILMVALIVVLALLGFASAEEEGEQL